LDHVNSILNNDNIGFASFMTNRITLANLLSNSDDVNRLNDIGSSCSIAWSNGTHSHDSGIGDSPPFDNTKSSLAFKSSTSKPHDRTFNGMLGELNKVFGDLERNESAFSKVTRQIEDEKEGS